MGREVRDGVGHREWRGAGKEGEGRNTRRVGKGQSLPTPVSRICSSLLILPFPKALHGGP